MASNLQNLKDLESSLNTNNNYSNNHFSQTIYINPLTNGVTSQTTPTLMESAKPLVQPASIQPSIYNLIQNQPVNPVPNMLAMNNLSHANQLAQNTGFMNMQPNMMADMNPLLYNQMMMYAMPQQSAYMMNPQMAAMMNPQMFDMSQMMGGMNMGEDMAEMEDEEGDYYQNQDDNQELTEEQVNFRNMLEMMKENFQMDDEDETEQNIEEHQFETTQLEVEAFNLEFKNCSCCKGFTLLCDAEICKNLGVCHCVLRKEKEGELFNKQEIYEEDRKNCNCCKGYVLTCKGVACAAQGQCICLAE